MHQNNSEDVKARKRTEPDFLGDILGLFSERKTAYIFGTDLKWQI